MAADPRIHIVTPEEYERQRELEEAERKRPRTPAELRELAAKYQESARRWRAHIEREECPGGRGGQPRWAETKAILIEQAEWCERDAAQALAMAAEIEAADPVVALKR